MSIEKALIAQAQPYMVEARIRSIIGEETRKGCSPDLSKNTVSLEPYFEPLWKSGNRLNTDSGDLWTLENPVSKEDLMRLQVWISPEHVFDWVHSERFIKQLRAVSYRIGFEVIGNGAGITLGFLLHHRDLPIIATAFHGEFDLCEFTPMEENPLDALAGQEWQDVLFRDYLPSPPYSHLLSRPQELQISSLTTLITALSTIEAPALGIYQTLLQPVSPNKNWHRNVEILLDVEYTAKLQNEIQFPRKYSQQSPSGDLHQMAGELENKAHNDKPFYTAALRLAVVGGGKSRKALLSALSTFMGLFQHGGRPLGYLTEKEYAEILSAGQVRNMFLQGLTYRPGFLVNSQELTGPVHIPALPGGNHPTAPMKSLEMLPVRNSELFTGTQIGTCDYAGSSQKVCVPPEFQGRHLHVIGASGVGKTTTIENMILEDIEEGHGVAVLDPHGDMVERLLYLIKKEHVKKTIYFNPADPYWVPLWNPLKLIPGQEIGRVANDLVMAIKSFVDSGGWGDRLENILRNMIYGLLHLEGGTFLDISNLLHNKSKQNELLIREMLKVIDNQTARQFWEHDYKGYGKGDLSPPINKLSKLLISGPVSLMLSQPENRFNFRNIMDQGNILLVNLSNMGVTVRQVLGCFILSNLHLSALSRSDIPIEKRKPFHIYCDEAPNFITESIENVIAETRKYSVNLTLAHQYLSQFNTKKRDALSTVGTSIIFKVDKRDADYLAKDLQGKVKADDLISLGVGEAFARIGADIVKVKTSKPLKIPETHFRERIIEESRRKFCKPASEVKKWLRQAGNRWSEPYAPLNPSFSESSTGDIEELDYEEF